ncbi:MAG: alanyl-tRNA editing protein [Alphaproteobacteria bacterium]|nr:alanyl-tRNA editing protein [Alphaproteobacteria bacterium]
MTKSLYNDNAYLKSCAAKIISVDDVTVQLDQTVFYPLGGGQLGDTGILSVNGEDYNIIDTIWGEGTKISHILDRPLAADAISADVTLSLDWQRRFRLMQIHTCLHLICSMFDYPIVGARVGPDKGHLDYLTEGAAIDKIASNEILQDLIAQNFTIETEKVAEDEFDEFMQGRHLIGGMPPVKNGVVRFVRIGDVAAPLDYQPCGGTHVLNTSEIMPLQVQSIKSKGKGIRRLAVQFSG